jgi:hypothetical protein
MKVICRYLYQDSSDFVDGRDGLPGWIKDLTDPNAQNLMLRSIIDRFDFVPVNAEFLEVFQVR